MTCVRRVYRIFTVNMKIVYVRSYFPRFKTLYDYLEDAFRRVGQGDVWLGAGAIVLDGVSIEKGSVIGAGAVVSKDIPPYSVAVGVPARVVRNRK